MQKLTFLTVYMLGLYAANEGCHKPQSPTCATQRFTGSLLVLALVKLDIIGDSPRCAGAEHDT